MIRLILLLLFTVSISTAAQDISITIQPVSVVECVGNPVNIFINAESKVGNNLQYQWYKDGEKVSEAVSPVLKFTSLQHNQSGLYYCQVTSEGTSESVNSIIASVYALRPTSITLEPEDIKTNISSGSISLNFDAHINGFTIEEAIQKGENVKIQWYQVEGNINIPLEDNPIYNGTKTNKLNITFNNISDTTKYFASIEGKCGIVTTRIASVIKNFNELVLKLEDLDACEGIIYSLKAQITNPQNHKLEFQWYKNGQPIYYKENLKGIYSDELFFEPIYMKDSGNYKIEAKIKDINYKVFSNEVSVRVGKEPKIVCIRADTSIWGKKGALNRWSNNLMQFNIFYEINPLPIQFDIFQDGKLISTLNSNDSHWNLGDVYYLNLMYIKRNDTSKYWVIAHNKCGNAYSDTISTYNQSNCDPFYQFRSNLCVNQPLTLKINHHLPERPLNEWKYQWVTYEIGKSMFLEPPYKDGSTILLHLKLFKSYLARDNNKSIDNYDFSLEVSKDSIYNGVHHHLDIDIFCCVYLQMGYIPVIKRQPVNKELIYGEKDTIIYIYFDNEFNKNIEVELYYMASLKNKPRLVDKSAPEYGRWYTFIKNATFAEDGYYFALAKYDNYCDSVITDTIRVNVIPKGIAADVNENGIEPYFSIQPNPTTNFIDIKLNNEASLLAAGKVQIFDILGIEVMFESIHPMTGSHRMNVERLPAGVYYIRIGDKVEKFLKM